MQNANPFLYLNLFILLLVFSMGCTHEKKSSEESIEFILHDPLPSWNEGKNKQDILHFVLNSSHEDSVNYIAHADRIAVFDNDGTLWSEKPMYFQAFFAVYQIQKHAQEHPEWNDQEPFSSIIEKGIYGLKGLNMKELGKIIMVTHSGMSTSEFQEEVSEWIKTEHHPRFNVPFNELVYQPMLELIQFLRAYDYKVFIVSGGGQDFMRAWATEVYGIPSHQIIGSSIKKEYKVIDGTPVIMRLPEMDFIDDKEGKPIGIQNHIGKRPAISVGNSDGDLEMMEYTAAGTGPSLQIFVHHTDSIREWAYDRDSHVGKFDVALDRALEEGWNLIDMKEDWKTIYPKIDPH